MCRNSYYHVTARMSFDHIKMDILANDFIDRTNYEKCIAPRNSIISKKMKKCINSTETPFVNTIKHN